MSGTKLAYGAISLCACYAMSGTDLAYGAISLCACYAMPGTEIAYGQGLWVGGPLRVRSRECSVRNQRGKPAFQYGLYQGTGFASLISRWTTFFSSATL
eukprot:2807825-Rhodomonas_salina.1